MGRQKISVAVLGAAFLLGGCSFVDEGLWPTLTGEEPAGQAGESIVIGPSPSEQQLQPTLSPPPYTVPQYSASLAAPAYAAAPAQPIGATGTFVGAKVSQHASELQSLKSGIGNGNARFQQLRVVSEQNAQRYYAIVAAISARLQIGTTPGNPVLVSQWNTAQSELDRILTDIAALNTLANDIAGQSAMSAYLVESISAAYGLSGAVEEDHRQLALIEDEVNRTVVLIDRLLNEIHDTISRQTAYVNNERRNLTSLSLAVKNGEMFGPPLASRAFAAAVASQTSAVQSSASLGFNASRQPLVVIRFDRPDVPYQQALYSALSQALDRVPMANFDVIAVAPNMGTPAQVALNTNESKRNAEQVFRSLTDMGLSGDRVTLSTATSSAVQTNEVHVFVR
ncbi:MAG: hypothetical protein VCB77_03955 [Alphaproteobacteria bacterium]